MSACACADKANALQCYRCVQCITLVTLKISDPDVAGIHCSLHESTLYHKLTQ